MSIVSGLVPIELVAMTKKYEQMKDNFKQKVVDTKGGNVGVVAAVAGGRNVANHIKRVPEVPKKALGLWGTFKAQLKRQIKKHPYIAGIIITVYGIVMFLNQNNFIRMGTFL